MSYSGLNISMDDSIATTSSGFNVPIDSINILLTALKNNN